MLINSYLPLAGAFGTAFAASVAPAIADISKALLVVTLFLIGAGLSLDKIKSVGFKPLILGICLWVVVSILSLLAIVH